MSNILQPLHNPAFLSVEQIISHAVQEQLLVLDRNLVVLAASKSFYTTFQATPYNTVGKKLFDLGNGQWKIPALLTLLNELPKKDGEFEDLLLEHVTSASGRRTMQASARRLSGDDDQRTLILLSILDITGQKLIEAEATVLAARYRTILASIGGHHCHGP
jgi:hypothetical protein